MSVDPLIAKPAADNRMGPDLGNYESITIAGATAAAKQWLAAPRFDESFRSWLPWLGLTLGFGAGLASCGAWLGGIVGLVVGLLSLFTLPVFVLQLGLAMAVSATRPPPACPACQAPDSPFQPYTDFTDLLPHGEEIWVAQQPLVFMGLPFGTRCTVVRIGEDLLIHSPIALKQHLRESLEELGRVRWILAPNVLHHLYVPEWIEAWPEVEVWAAPGLVERRPDIAWTGTIEEGEAAPWPVPTEVVRGHPFHIEVVLFHEASKTLVLTDLLENLGHAPESPPWLRVIIELFGMGARPSPPTDWKWTLDDRPALKRSVDRMLAWPFERIVLGHGRLIDQDARATLERAYAFLED